MIRCFRCGNENLEKVTMFDNDTIGTSKFVSQYYKCGKCGLEF